DQIRWWENLDCFLIPDFQADVHSGHAPLTVSFQEECYSRPEAVDWNWDFGDDFIIDTQGPQVTWTFTEPSYYDVRLYASNGIISETNLKEDYIRVFDGESSFEINGSSGKAECRASCVGNIAEQFTMEAWINPQGWGESTTSGGMIMDKTAIKLFLCQQHNALNDQCLMLRLSTEGAPFSLIATPDFSINLDEWTHIAASYEGAGNQVGLYINGVLQELSFLNAPSGNISDNSTSSLYLGNNGGESSSFHGVIDEVRIWSSVLSVEEISQNMNSILSGNEPGLLAYWRLNEGCGDESCDLTDANNTLFLDGVRWAQGLHLENNPLDEHTLIPGNEIYNPEIFPNPFNPSTTVSFYLPAEENVSLNIYNLKGQLVSSLSRGKLSAGWHQLIWNGVDHNGSPVCSGIYLLQFSTGKYDSLKKILLLK
ncbi:MAG: T9SS type A sorting domain-containing protein, partial [Candidatus Cloacimonetes bacterium]|nr:T9SS type A sorting domain-containing protein [Candidatus Cloacimonadota bacterium]